MKNLFFGGSSELALDIASSISNSYSISRKKNKIFKKNYIVKNYSENELSKKLKFIKNTKFDNIIIFNGIFNSSFLSNLEDKAFSRTIDINLKIPLIISKFCISKKIINYNGCIYFISSIAAIKPEIGNAYYALSKNALNFASKILYLEQKKRSIRVNTILLGLIKNKMGNNLIDTLPLIKKNKLKFSKVDDIIKKIKKLLKDKKISGKTIKL